MNVTVTPAPRSSLSVRVELPPERLDSAIAEAVRHLSQRTKIHGFRPGKAPRAVVERAVGSEAILEEAMDHLVQRAYRDALVEHKILPLAEARDDWFMSDEEKERLAEGHVARRDRLGGGTAPRGRRRDLPRS